jgi:hypothetical protein
MMTPAINIKPELDEITVAKVSENAQIVMPKRVQKANEAMIAMDLNFREMCFKRSSWDTYCAIQSRPPPTTLAIRGYPQPPP